ncbi:MAG: U32 family peptidase [Eubacteriales bacterium]
MSQIKLPEILAPAGNFEKLCAAVRFGADAVYLAGRRFGMRQAAENFSLEELREAARYLHSRGKKMYLTVNILPHGGEYPALREFIAECAKIDIDGYIVADLGVIAMIKSVNPKADIHISTQASIVSPEAAMEYVKLGATRLVLARELSLEEIRDIRAAIPPEIELEAFVHGSMCVSYSGRCMLSDHLVGRSANHGACAQPCRWNYKIVEEKRPEEGMPIVETDEGTFIMSSKDMCMIDHVAELVDAGISSFKLEGRVRSAYYAAVVTNAYRIALDALAEHVENGGKLLDFKPDPALFDEVDSVSHREYSTGFYFNSPREDSCLVTRQGYMREKAYLAVAEQIENELPEPLKAIEQTQGGRLVRFRQRNKLVRGMTAELLTPGKVGRAFTVEELYDGEGEAVESAPHPSRIFYTRVPMQVLEGDILRAE